MSLTRSEFKRVAPTGERKRRTKKCKVKACRKEFTPWRAIQPCCSIACEHDWIMSERVRKERKERTEGLRALRTRTDHAKLAQKAVNRYVNLRDRNKPCVSCGKPAQAGGVRNASHFKSVGSNSALRFHLWNIHTSCYRCNVELSGNLGEYYPRLIERIGAAKVEYLQCAKRERRYEIDYLQRITKIFTKKAKRLTNSGASR